MARPNHSYRRLLVLLFLGLIVCGLPCLFFAAQMGAFRTSRDTPELDGVPRQEVARPQPVSRQGYVGSGACRKCHAEISEKYARHPMGRSAEMLPAATELEDYSPAKAEFSGNSGYRYRVDKQGDKIVHHEMAIHSRSGAVLHDQAEVVSLAVGAGIRGRSYAVVHDGFLLQSPITWYAAGGGSFNLSPGYHLEGLHFNRPWLKECLHCHTGRALADEQSESRFSFPELAIGCERCHGPGERHVNLQESKPSSSPDHSIVNPSSLAMRERESICYDCHLEGVYRTPRYGRSVDDFRPGMALEEVACILVPPLPLTGSAEAVSQVEQMWSSPCFLRSSGKLGCISCHDPHEQPAPEKRQAFYRERCLQCHAEQGCSLPVPQREKEDDSCIACHMPRSSARNIAHVAQSDHRIPRLAASSTRTLANPPGPRQLQFFDHADERLPRWEVMRARAMQQAEQGGLASLNSEEAASLLALTQVLEGDVSLFYALGNHYLNVKRYPDARSWLEKASQADPRHEAALADLAYACQMQNEPAEALQYIDRSLKLNPWIARRHGLRAEVLAALGQLPAAAEAAGRAIELDPGEAKQLGRLAESKK
jgi:hypothetical protein